MKKKRNTCCIALTILVLILLVISVISVLSILELENKMKDMPKRVCTTTWKTEVIDVECGMISKEMPCSTEIMCEEGVFVEKYCSIDKIVIYGCLGEEGICIIRTPIEECHIE